MDKWKLKSFLLDFVKLDDSHSGANIKEAFLKSLRSYGIKSKVSFINSDNLKTEKQS